MMGFGMIGGMLLLWLALAALAVVLARGLFQKDHAMVTIETQSARQVLDRRFARGEIDLEQYVTMLKDIE
jgi:uncharacterized membrane protein